MKEAAFYDKLENKTIRCHLCPQNCLVAPNDYGHCKARKNIDGTLICETYSLVSAMHTDPIEKKPLYHFYPGSEIFSIGSIGCNFRCNFCQNCEISQTSVAEFRFTRKYTPEEIVFIAAKNPNNIGIAYTYNEPNIWYEFIMDVAPLVHEKKLKNVMVSNGYINKEPLQNLLNYIDAFNIDLKAFDNYFYKKNTTATLEPVKQTLIQIRKANRHLEITNLVIPTLNDNPKIFEEMIKWIAGELGETTVFHLSRYFPRYQLNIEATPSNILSNLFQIATKHLKYVYLGNINLADGNDTICPNCHSKVILREGYRIETIGMTLDGKCSTCGNEIAINS